MEFVLEWQCENGNAKTVLNWMVEKAAALYNTEFRGEEVNDSTLLMQLIYNIIFSYSEDQDNVSLKQQGDSLKHFYSLTI